MKLHPANMEASMAMILAGTHSLTYYGLDGARYRVRYLKDGLVGHLCVRRVDGRPFKLNGRMRSRYQPLANRHDLANFIKATAEDPAAQGELEPRS